MIYIDHWKSEEWRKDGNEGWRRSERSGKSKPVENQDKQSYHILEAANDLLRTAFLPILSTHKPTRTNTRRRFSLGGYGPQAPDD